MEGGGDFEAGNYAGRNMHFGIREHGMGAIVNGMCADADCGPLDRRFLSSPITCGRRCDWRPSWASSFYVFTHDSIGVGEDGPTHQPIEHLAALRAIPI